MVQESLSWDHGKVPIRYFFVSIHKTRGSEWSNRAYKRVSRESLWEAKCFVRAERPQAHFDGGPRFPQLTVSLSKQQNYHQARGAAGKLTELGCLSPRLELGHSAVRSSRMVFRNLACLAANVFPHTKRLIN